MSEPLIFDWHDAKHLSNIAKHGLGFDRAVAVFLDERRIDIDAPHPEDGEIRRKTTGLLGLKLFSVVYTMRGDVHWLISARRANPKEIRRYVQR